MLDRPGSCPGYESRGRRRARAATAERFPEWISNLIYTCRRGETVVLFWCSSSCNFSGFEQRKKTQHVPKSSTNPTTTKHEKKHKTGKLEYFKQKAQDYSKSSTIPTTKQHKKEHKTV